MIAAMAARRGIRRSGTGLLVLLLLVLGAGLLLLRPGSPAGPVIATVPTDRFPVPLLVDLRSSRAVIGSPDSRRLLIVDTATGQVVRTITLAQPLSPFVTWNARNVNAQGGRVVFLEQPNGGALSPLLAVLDVRGGTLRTAPLPAGVYGPGFALAADFRTGRIFFDTSHV